MDVFEAYPARGAPLLPGTALVSRWIGPHAAFFAAVAVLVVIAYAAPGCARRIAICRVLRRPLRGLPGA
ncbi:hypothetical protein [Streptomyces sp. NPDC054804]